MTSSLSDQYYEAGFIWADLDAAASLLEECKSAYLSQMMAKTGIETVSKAEMKVKASPEWTRYIEKMVEARRDANKAKIKTEYLRQKFHEQQSKEATERVAARI